MAFTQPYTKPIVLMIKEAETSTPQGTPNLLRKLSVALKSTYAELQATRSFTCSVYRGSFPTDISGNLVLGKSLPILGKRYRLTELIGKGTFSQIFKANCAFHFNDVAVKVLRIGYGMLGQRECAFLKFFNKKTLHGAKFCKCLAFPLKNL